MHADDVEFARERTRAERDAEGFNHAIYISSDDEGDETAASRPAPPVVAHARGCSGGSSAATAHGKRPAEAPGADVKPDIKRLSMPAPPDFSASAAPAHRAQPTDLEDLSFATPLPGAKGRSKRAGHVMLSMTAAGRLADDATTDPMVDIGHGLESTPHAKLMAVPWQVHVEDAELFESLRRLANPTNTRRGRAAGFPLIDVEWQPKLPWRLRRGAPVEVRLDVWLCPEIFDLRISNWQGGTSCFYDIWMLFEKLVPMAPLVQRPRPPPVQGDAVLMPCGAASFSAPSRPAPTAQSFTLAGLMRAMESAGYDEMADPPGLALSLYPFQRQSLQWMVDRETQPGGLNALFWQERPAEHDESFFYNAMAGELRASRLPIVTGGFLCEEMGLGKTVEMCALILAHPFTPAESAVGRKMLTHGGTRRPTKATLIVVPVVLLEQWQAEIAKCTAGRLTVVVHHGPHAMKRDGIKDVQPLEAADIVLTTYEVLRAEAPWPAILRCLLRMHWWRVVLDESQRVPRPAGAASAMTAIA